MKIRLLVLFTIVASICLLSACGPSAANQQATIDAAVKGTAEAQQSSQATIEAAVKATSQAAQAAQNSDIEKSVQATISAQPTPDPGMSEEELAALIEESVTKAMTDYASTSATVSTTTSDGTVTDEEASTTYNQAYNVYYEAAYAEELIQTYYEIYGAYADEALATMNAMEADLAAISDSMNEIAGIMEQGAETATAAINQVNDALNQAQSKADELQAKAKGLQDQVKSGLSQREDGVMGLKANDIANNQLGAINQANDFLEAFKSALGDGKFSPEELSSIGQLAANAKASLDRTGDPKLQRLGGSIDGLTRQAARGDWGNARKGLGDFERSVPKRRK